METTQALATLLYSAMTLIEVGLLQLPLPLKQQLHFEANLKPARPTETIAKACRVRWLS